MREMNACIADFTKQCEEYGTIEDVVDITFYKNYFSLYAEVDDDTDDGLVCKQEFEIEDSDCTPINALHFEIEE